MKMVEWCFTTNEVIHFYYRYSGQWIIKQQRKHVLRGGDDEIDPADVKWYSDYSEENVQEEIEPSKLRGMVVE